MNTIRKFNRFELKYLLPLAVAQELKGELAKYMQRDLYGKEGKYELSSLYYDSDDYRFYWEKIEGIKFRRKLRIRAYLDENPLSEESRVFLEIKQRVDRVIQKRRMPIKYGEALLFCNHGVIPKHEDCDQDLIDEVGCMLHLYQLKPAVITTYDRHAFIGSDYDLGLRITFDTNIKFAFRDLNMANKNSDGFMIPSNYVIMEIKTNERIPYWITEMISAHNFRLIRVSKYCQGLEKASLTPKSIYNIF
jgi:SPX domain protein involved in polyphosphate accumulation